jgi:hypothetical protein
MEAEAFDLDAPSLAPFLTFGTPPGLMLSADVAESCRLEFERTGALLVRNIGDVSRVDLLELLRLSFPFQKWGGDYVGGANDRNGSERAGNNVYDIGVPPQAAALFHHEMQYMQNSVEALAFYCEESTGDATPTLLSCAATAFRRLEGSRLLDRLLEEGVAYHRGLTDGDFYPTCENSGHYNHWQNCFGATSEEEALKVALECGLSAWWTVDPRVPESGSYMQTAFVASPVEERNGERYLFATLADSEEWFRSWPSLGSWKKEELPLRMTYGSGGDISSDDRDAWWRAVHARSLRIDWKRGDLLVLCNLRWAHGRPVALSGSVGRQLAVTFGTKMRRAHMGGAKVEEG